MRNPLSEEQQSTHANKSKNDPPKKEKSIWESKEAKRRVRLEKNPLEMLHPSQKALRQGCLRIVSFLIVASIGTGVVGLIALYWLNGESQAATVEVEATATTVNLNDLWVPSPTVKATATPTVYATRVYGILTPTRTPTPEASPTPESTATPTITPTGTATQRATAVQFRTNATSTIEIAPMPEAEPTSFSLKTDALPTLAVESMPTQVYFTSSNIH